MKEMLYRAMRTFFQAALGYILTYGVAALSGDGDIDIKTALLGLGVSSVAAGLAAVMNLPKGAKKDEEV